MPFPQALSAMAVHRHGSAADLAAVPPPQQLQMAAAGGLQTFSGSSQGARLPPPPAAMEAPPLLGAGFATGLPTPPYSRYERGSVLGIRRNEHDDPKSRIWVSCSWRLIMCLRLLVA